MMARDAAKIAAMRDFVLANSSNLQTALLIQDAMSGVREKLISDIARRVSGGLQEKDQGWHVLENSLATDPLSKWVLLRWGPPEWRAYGWGVSLSAERPNARGMFFGLRAPSKETTDRKDWQARAMPDEDRGRLFAELAPVLRSAIGHKASKSDWWPCWLWLPNEILDWDQHTALNKIAYALGIVNEPALVAGKKLDDFLIDAFRAAQQAIVPIIEKRSIEPIPE